MSKKHISRVKARGSRGKHANICASYILYKVTLRPDDRLLTTNSSTKSTTNTNKQCAHETPMSSSSTNDENLNSKFGIGN